MQAPLLLNTRPGCTQGLQHGMQKNQIQLA